MKKNIGKTDKIIRIVLGILIGAAGLYFESWLGLIGVIPIATALVSRCGLYVPFGINTCKK